MDSQIGHRSEARVKRQPGQPLQWAVHGGFRRPGQDFPRPLHYAKPTQHNTQ